MLVYNLTNGEVTYKGKKVPPNGGSVNIPDLSFIPNRDLELEKARILAFGSLPRWWAVEQALKTTVAAPVPVVELPPMKAPEKKIVITTEAPVEVEDKSSVSAFNKRK